LNRNSEHIPRSLLQGNIQKLPQITNINISVIHATGGLSITGNFCRLKTIDALVGANLADLKGHRIQFE